MRKELYLKLIEALKGIGFKHFDLWNRQVEFLEEEVAFPMPAIFVEFGDIEWSPVKGESVSGKGSVILHIVEPFTGSAADGSSNRDEVLETLDWSEKIQKALSGLSGDNFHSLGLSVTKTNHDHADIIESIEVYSLRTGRELN